MINFFKIWTLFNNRFGLFVIYNNMFLVFLFWHNPDTTEDLFLQICWSDFSNFKEILTLKQPPSIPSPSNFGNSSLVEFSQGLVTSTFFSFHTVYSTVLPLSPWPLDLSVLKINAFSSLTISYSLLSNLASCLFSNSRTKLASSFLHTCNLVLLAMA